MNVVIAFFKIVYGFMIGVRGKKQKDYLMSFFCGR